MGPQTDTSFHDDILNLSANINSSDLHNSPYITPCSKPCTINNNFGPGSRTPCSSIQDSPSFAQPHQYTQYHLQDQHSALLSIEEESQNLEIIKFIIDHNSSFILHHPSSSFIILHHPSSSFIILHHP